MPRCSRSLRLSKRDRRPSSISHIKPTGIGSKVSATAVLAVVEGRKLSFNVAARDEEGMIGEGTHTRFIVDSERFMGKVR